jgi:hypothetical protein
MQVQRALCRGGCPRCYQNAVRDEVDLGDGRTTLSHCATVGARVWPEREWGRCVYTLVAGEDWQPIEAVGRDRLTRMAENGFNCVKSGLRTRCLQGSATHNTVISSSFLRIRKPSCHLHNRYFFAATWVRSCNRTDGNQ